MAITQPHVRIVTGAKGGVGTSVIAAALALATAAHQPVLLLDNAGGDLARLLGASAFANEPTVNVVPNVTISRLRPAGDERLPIKLLAADAVAPAGVVIIDAGVHTPDLDQHLGRPGWATTLVTTNDLVAVQHARSIDCDAVVATCHPDRVYDMAELRDILNSPVVHLPHSPQITQAVELSTLTTGLPGELQAALTELAALELLPSPPAPDPQSRPARRQLATTR